MDRELRVKLKKLAKLMNEKTQMKLPIIPEVIDSMECIITPEEADFLLAVGNRRILVNNLRSLSKLNDEEYEVFITEIFKKGLLMVYADSNGDYAELFHIFPGWIELVLADGVIDENKKQFVNSFSKVLKTTERFNVQPVRGIFNTMYKAKVKKVAPITISLIGESEKKQVIKLNQQIDSGENIVMPTNNVISLINSLPDDYPIALMACFCRILSRLQGNPCHFDLSEESCIFIGNQAKQMIKFKVGKSISKEKAISIIEECEKNGAMHNVYHEGMNTNNPEISICNCCWDCCCMHANYNRGGLTPMFFKTYYKAEIINSEKCVSCGKCTKYCPTTALTINDSKINFDSNICIGCGQCSFQCPCDVFHMKYGERNVFVPSIPKSKARIH